MKRPRNEVVFDRCRAAGALALADGDVLVEGGGALDGGLIGARILVDIVSCAVAGVAPFHSVGIGEREAVFHDVILD